MTTPTLTAVLAGVAREHVLKVHRGRLWCVASDPFCAWTRPDTPTCRDEHAAHVAAHQAAAVAEWWQARREGIVAKVDAEDNRRISHDETLGVFAHEAAGMVFDLLAEAAGEGVGA